VDIIHFRQKYNKDNWNSHHNQLTVEKNFVCDTETVLGSSIEWAREKLSNNPFHSSFSDCSTGASQSSSHGGYAHSSSSKSECHSNEDQFVLFSDTSSESEDEDFDIDNTINESLKPAI